MYIYVYMYIYMYVHYYLNVLSASLPPWPSKNSGFVKLAGRGVRRKRLGPPPTKPAAATRARSQTWRRAIKKLS